MTLEELRKIAEAATPGPGTPDVQERVTNVDAKSQTLIWDVSYPEAEFIAAFSPSTVLALLDRLKRAEEALEIVSYGECECVLQDNLCAVCIAEEALAAIREPLK